MLALRPVSAALRAIQRDCALAFPIKTRGVAADTTESAVGAAAIAVQQHIEQEGQDILEQRSSRMESEEIDKK